MTPVHSPALRISRLGAVCFYLLTLPSDQLPERHWIAEPQCCVWKAGVQGWVLREHSSCHCKGGKGGVSKVENDSWLGRFDPKLLKCIAGSSQAEHQIMHFDPNGENKFIIVSLSKIRMVIQVNICVCCYCQFLCFSYQVNKLSLLMLISWLNNFILN